MSPPTFKKLLADEGVSVLQLGRSVRIDVVDLVELMERNKVLLRPDGRIPNNQLELDEELLEFGRER